MERRYYVAFISENEKGPVIGSFFFTSEENMNTEDGMVTLMKKISADHCEGAGVTIIALKELEG